jgi:hypothetical protein
VDAPNRGTWAGLQAEATTIVTEAGEAGVTLRVMGSAGIRLHCAAPGPAMDLLGRQPKDIDLVVPDKHRKGMRRYLESRGYVTDRDLLIAMEGTRYSFCHSEHGTELDVFVEKLNFCHVIEVRSRLGRHPVTLAVEDLILGKLQIIEMTVTDVMDVAVILATHRVRDDDADPEGIDSGYIAGLLARDWGFHHTATRNLARMTALAGESPAADLGPGPVAQVREGIGQLLARIDAEPKSLAWRMRDKIGERKQWWQDVDEKEATY